MWYHHSHECSKLIFFILDRSISKCYKLHHSADLLTLMLDWYFNTAMSSDIYVCLSFFVSICHYQTSWNQKVILIFWRRTSWTLAGRWGICGQKWVLEKSRETGSWAAGQDTQNYWSPVLFNMNNDYYPVKNNKAVSVASAKIEKIVSCYVNPPGYFTQEFEQLWVNFSVGFPKYILLSLKRFHSPWVIYYFDWSSPSLNFCAWSSSLTHIFVHPKFPQNMILKFGIFVSFLFGLQCVSPSSRAACGLTHSQLHEIPV